ncbi:D-alanyl-D-alanine carboxypeptidase/D-alanyl-D-alanine-endopeptidase [Paralimibaculum aggregatum]|uniref:D-alanyl-D-alanine carboxypeptidase/D-alanyl-D-alanine-endopeptidase n=1 Tax=Paralimibaculum aggregatum TaxID=3036245 RepID=A0ABQ6LIX4_9RHOB|nr:D-alanyl-D-alanine carboxypeptidase/D-alanyl-D-alanine-endopeptidase [Limibaculum sp. NKW23]GMG83236.1 D-alanyl-D-alanine carboxypeptidase/D-alanyl-D-alanine-endopeptidase [Limibaculum sp. NKW23]
MLVARKSGFGAGAVQVAGALLACAALLGAVLPGAARAEAPQRAPVPLARAFAAPAPVLPEDGSAIRARLGLSGNVGWALADLATGEVIDSHEAERSFAPASVTKLPTALYALHELGAEHRFETRLLATGPVAGGVLRGDLVLVGGLDPELDTDMLDGLAEALERARIGKITGRFLVDPGVALTVEAIDPQQPVDVAYNPGIAGLNLNFNRVFLRWGPRVGTGSGGDGVSLTAKAQRLDPPVSSVKAVVGGETGTRYGFVHRIEADREVWGLAERVLKGRGSRWLPVKRPALYAADVLRSLAQARGIRLPVPQLGRSAEGDGAPRLLARVQSRPLAPILRDMLKYSTNITAEVVGTAASFSAGAVPATLTQSAALMNAWATQIAGGAPGDPRMRFVNHSGLTTESRVSPLRMVQFLVAATRLAHGPIPGTSRLPGAGALLLRDYSVAVEDDPIPLDEVEIRAKTGTMDYIRGLAGYIQAEGDRRYAFAIFSNDLRKRGAPRRGIDRSWMNRARGFERALIRSWIQRFGSFVPQGG